MFRKKSLKKFIRKFIEEEGCKTGINFTVYLEVNQFYGQRVEFDKEDLNIIHVYGETANDWEPNQPRSATDIYFHIDEVYCVQKSYPAQNDPNLIIKAVLAPPVATSPTKRRR